MHAIHEGKLTTETVSIKELLQDAFEVNRPEQNPEATSDDQLDSMLAQPVSERA